MFLYYYPHRIKGQLAIKEQLIELRDNLQMNYLDFGDVLVILFLSVQVDIAITQLELKKKKTQV